MPSQMIEEEAAAALKEAHKLAEASTLSLTDTMEGEDLNNTSGEEAAVLRRPQSNRRILRTDTSKGLRDGIDDADIARVAEAKIAFRGEEEGHHAERPRPCRWSSEKDLNGLRKTSSVGLSFGPLDASDSSETLLTSAEPSPSQQKDEEKAKRTPASFSESFKAGGGGGKTGSFKPSLLSVDTSRALAPAPAQASAPEKQATIPPRLPTTSTTSSKNEPSSSVPHQFFPSTSRGVLKSAPNSSSSSRQVKVLGAACSLSIALPITEDMLKKVESFMGELTDTRDLIVSSLSSQAAKAKEGLITSLRKEKLAATEEEEADRQKKEEEDAKPAGPSCWQAFKDSPSFKLSSSVKESLSQVCVLTTARHLIKVLIKTREDLHTINRTPFVELKELIEVVTATLQGLTALRLPKKDNNVHATSPLHEDGGSPAVFEASAKGYNPFGEGKRLSISTTSDSEPLPVPQQSPHYLKNMPIGLSAVRYFREIPFLSHLFLSLVRTSVKLLAACDDHVRRLVLDNAISGRYFFSIFQLRRDLHLIWDYLVLGTAFLEYYGQLSKEVCFNGSLPWAPLAKIEIFALISIGYANYKADMTHTRRSSLEKNHRRASLRRGSRGGERRDSRDARDVYGNGPSQPTSVSTPPTPTSPPTLNGEMDNETLITIRDAFFSGNGQPFICSTFLVTFVQRGIETRPKIERWLEGGGQQQQQVELFPQLYLALSRRLFVSQCTPEGLEDYFKKHYQAILDYLTCTDIAGLADAALGNTDPGSHLSLSGVGAWTGQLYADIVVSSFISRFYQDFQRKVATDASVLSFSSRFAQPDLPEEEAGRRKTNRMASLRGLLDLGRSSRATKKGGSLAEAIAASQAKDINNSSSFSLSASCPVPDRIKPRALKIDVTAPEQLGRSASSPMSPPHNVPCILQVSERVMDGLSMANMISTKDSICACEIIEATIIWYILWARSSLARAISASTKPRRKESVDASGSSAGSPIGGSSGSQSPTSGEATYGSNTVFDSLRRICALCADVNGIARFCDTMINKMRPDESSMATPSSPYSPYRSVMTPSSPYRARTPTSNNNSISSPAALSPNTPSQRPNRKGFIVSPANRGHRQTMSLTSSITPRGTHRSSVVDGLGGGGGVYSPPVTPGGTRRSLLLQGDGGPHGGGDAGDITGHEVILNDLFAMVEELRLLSAECSEHATELATKLTYKICAGKLGGGGGGGLNKLGVSSSTATSLGASGAGGGNGKMISNVSRRMSTRKIFFRGGIGGTTGSGGAGGGDGATASRDGSSGGAKAPSTGLDISNGGIAIKRSSSPTIAGTAEGDKGEGPRTWAVDLKTHLFQPLARFCRSVMEGSRYGYGYGTGGGGDVDENPKDGKGDESFCSEVLLPRLVEACLHSVLEVVATDLHGRISVYEAKALHTDFLHLKDWTVAEGQRQPAAAKGGITTLSIFDRIHVVLDVLGLPISLSAWPAQDRAALYQLPDAPRWIDVRTDRGKMRFQGLPLMSRSTNTYEQTPLTSSSDRLSSQIEGIPTEEFEKIWAEHMNARRSSGGALLWNVGGAVDTGDEG